MIADRPLLADAGAELVPRDGVAVATYWWGIAGPALLLLRAVIRLGPATWQAIRAPQSATTLAILALVMLLMAWFEGYRGFQRRVVPRVIARATLVANSGSILQRCLAPLVASDLVLVPRAALLRRWLLVVLIVVVVLLSHRLSAPWRGIVQSGVFAGMSWGLVSLLVLAARPHSVEPDRSPA